MTKPFFFKSTCMAAVVASLSMIAPSTASAMELTYDESVIGLTSVNVKDPEGSFLAGGFKMKDVESMDTFVVFCLDLLAVISNNETYTYETTGVPFTNGDTAVNLTENGGVARIQMLFDSGYETALDSAVNSAGFQVALWNAVYDDDWSVADGDGTFYQTQANDGVRDAANDFLAAASVYEPNSAGIKWNMTFLESQETPRSQNLVTVSAVPIPAAGLMLLTALGGLALGRRRKST